MLARLGLGMADEARQVAAGLCRVVARKVSLHGLQLAIEAGLDAVGRQVEAVDQADQSADLIAGSYHHHLEAATDRAK